MMKSIVLFLSLLALGSCLIDPKDPDAGIDPVQYAANKGFTMKEYNVTTEDGYILTVFRLLPANGSVVEGARPVILQHGILESGMDFLIGSPFVNVPGNSSAIGDNLAFVLVQTGRYDVWVGNSRGNRYSKGHVSLTPKDTDYWKFSYDQMAEYDLPATIALVRNETGSQTVGYIGFSQGTTTMFALMASNHEYVDIVQPFLALAPITYWNHVYSLVRLLAPVEPLLRATPGEFLLSNQIVGDVLPPFCRLPVAPLVCTSALFLVVGTDFSHMNQSRMQVYTSYMPSSISTWDLVQYLQLSNTGIFSMFNYGDEGNLKAYNSTQPPRYLLETIPSRAKIGFYAGSNDAFGDPQDVQQLRSILTEEAGITLIDDYLIPVAWNHLDFVYGEGVGEILYRRLIAQLDQYTQSLRAWSHDSFILSLWIKRNTWLQSYNRKRNYQFELAMSVWLFLFGVLLIHKCLTSGNINVDAAAPMTGFDRVYMVWPLKDVAIRFVHIFPWFIQSIYRSGGGVRSCRLSLDNQLDKSVSCKQNSVSWDRIYAQSESEEHRQRVCKGIQKNFHKISTWIKIRL